MSEGEAAQRMASIRIDVPEIESFNMSELDVSGLDMRLELTTLMPRILAPNCGPSYGCSCYSNSGCTCHSHNVYKCSCHSHNTCSCNSNTCLCHINCEVNG
jgi:hypothetical protein